MHGLQLQLSTSNEVAVASEDKKLEHPEWTDNVLSLKLTDGEI